MRIFGKALTMALLALGLGLAIIWPATTWAAVPTSALVFGKALPMALLAVGFGLAMFWPAATAEAAPSPALSLTVTPMPSNFAPGAVPNPEFLVVATNVGGAPTTGTTTVRAVLPEKLTPVTVSPIDTDPAGEASCSPPAGQEVKCETTKPLSSNRLLLMQVKVSVSPAAAPGTYPTKAFASAGGAEEVKTEFPTQVQTSPLAFGFLPGFIAPTTNEEGKAVTLSGSHPYQQTVFFAFPTVEPGDGLTNAGHPRDFTVELPRGMAGDPAANPVLCTELQLISTECPDDSQIGVSNVTTLLSLGISGVSNDGFFAMVPPPGAVAEFATNVAGAGVFAHIVVGVRSDDDYRLEAKAADVLALGTVPIFGVETQIWGEPTSEAHDFARGDCLESVVVDKKTKLRVPCPPLTRSDIALLTMPGECSGAPLPFEVLADSWEEPSPPFEEREALYESAELNGEPATLEGCGDEEVAFKPTIRSRPTTNLTDSPSGLQFTLTQPQDVLAAHRSPAPLRDAVVRFPAGMAVNPSQAAGLGACSEEQVGFEGEEEGTLFFSKASQSCPDAAKIGTLEVTSPALVVRKADHTVEVDPETGDPKLQPLHGTVYIAKPFDNPFDKLVALYLVIEDKQTGIVAKLAGEGQLDPTTGQITTRFEENPQLPLQDIKVSVFGGPRGALVTPPTCGRFTTNAQLTPWSAPQGKDAFPTDDLTTSATPLGGACPASEDQLPKASKLTAGTISPAAGKYSPLLFKLSREDGTQRLAKIDLTLPPGLSAKLAGVGTCSDADIAKAHSREAPNQGVLEQANPSCPASSEIGTVVAGTGAGPTPFYATGHAYIAGPYKGAPLSIVSIAPAIAGPFDLGTVVVRAALYLDPTTAQAHVLTDPLPQIIDGVPLDLRSIAVRADRPNFSINPTSCDVMSFGGGVTTALGQVTPLSERFQAGGCKSLPYKPKLTAKLFGPIHRGGHPRLRSVFTAKPGEANTARISFALPKSEFIDQAHFRTICTRVQFAASQCPAGSVYGHIKATSPLVDYAVEGPIYLRSSSHKLPDLVAALHGPPSQPIEVDLAGRVDSVNGGIRATFETVPDLPVTKAIVSMQGGKKGLFQNSTNICKGTHRATIKLDGQNGKVHDTQPLVKAQCGKGPKSNGGGGKKH
jgi:hypothetical protein